MTTQDSKETAGEQERTDERGEGRRRRRRREARQEQDGVRGSSPVWQLAVTFVWDGDDQHDEHPPRFDEPPALELSYRTSGTRVYWSCTPGRMQGEDHFMPTVHLPDHDLTSYRELLYRATDEIRTIKRRLRDGGDRDSQSALPKDEFIYVTGR